MTICLWKGDQGGDVISYNFSCKAESQDENLKRLHGLHTMMALVEDSGVFKVTLILSDGTLSKDQKVHPR